MLRTSLGNVGGVDDDSPNNKKLKMKPNKNAKKRKSLEATSNGHMEDNVKATKKPKNKNAGHEVVNGINKNKNKTNGNLKKIKNKLEKIKKPKQKVSPKKKIESDNEEDFEGASMEEEINSSIDDEELSFDLHDDDDDDMPVEEVVNNKVLDSSKKMKRKSLNKSLQSIKSNGIASGERKSLKFQPLAPSTNVVKMNSITEGLKAFQWLLNPIKVESFFEKYWEKNACLVRRHNPDYYKDLISFEAIDKMLLENNVEYSKNIDVTSYENGVRETLNPEGRAMPGEVWDFYRQDCSIRLLNPHMFLQKLFQLNTTMQEYFHCLVGANAYLTPPNSQGFAPHYDDIEAFVLQIEGRKRWKLYKPRNTNEFLPRFSSPNFSQDEIGEPVLEQVLEAGDMLYFPRGTIHQACTEPGYHSLHITLSAYQKQSFADLFEKMMPLILERAIASNVEMRRGLPLHTWQNAGIAFSETDSKERATLKSKVTKLLGQCLKDVCLDEVMDAAVDQLAKKYQHEALPPHISSKERPHTVFGAHTKTNKEGEAVSNYKITLRTNIRLLRANILRLVKEENTIRVYYYLDNSKEYCEYDANFIEIESEDASSVEVLVKSYPEYIGVSQLPVEDDEQKINIATILFNRGLLFLEKPLN